MFGRISGKDRSSVSSNEELWTDEVAVTQSQETSWWKCQKQRPDWWKRCTRKQEEEL